MRCSKCGTESLPGKRFCAECGSPIPIPCPKCGADTPANAKFCADCGTAIAGIARTSSGSSAIGLMTANEIRVAPEQGDAARVIEGERKTVTALFADIKGSMELIEDLDPEEARTIVDPALKLMIDAVHHYDGYIVQSTGDGIFALFGAPVAREDHPQRGLYAAVRMQEELKRYSDRIRAEGRVPIQVRVGVNTGEVVVRSIKTDQTHAEYTPIGHSTSLAARMQALAPIGSIAATENVRKLCEGYFVFKGLGLTRVKGVAEPVNVYEVTGLGPLRTRLQRAMGRGLTKFVGREREMESLKHAAEQAKSGHGQIVAAMAEAGVGKSRLFFEFKATSQSGWMVLETVSISHGKASAYLPLLDLLHGYFKIGGEDDQRTRREKLTGRILAPDRSLEDTLPYLFSLLGIVEGVDPLAQMDGQIRKRRTLEAIKRILLRESLNQPLIVIFEDLHWIDEATQEFLNLLADSLGTAKLLLLVNYRPEYSHKWGSKTYYTQLRLDPLAKESAVEMLLSLLGDNAELAPLKRLIIEKTEGNPFFMEETVQVLFDEGALVRDGAAAKLTKPLNALKIPPTVQGILAARIDRLPADAKELLQTLAVIGREFPISLIGAVVTKSDDQLNRLLNDLQLGEFIYEQPAVGDTEYIFKHALTQEVAYNSILLERRKQIHDRAAQAIEVLYEPNLSDHYADLARHYEHSGNAPKAINYLHLAGQQALSRSAFQEATAQLTSALELLRTQVESDERNRAEITLVLDLAMCRGMTTLSGLETLAAMLERALQLSEKITDDSVRLKGLEFLIINYSLLPDSLKLARALNGELVAIAQQQQDAELVGFARSRFGWLSMHEGDFGAALRELDEAYRISVTPTLPHRVRPINWLVHSRAFASIALWASGYPTRAIERAREAFAVARDIAAPVTERIFACWWAGNLYLLLRESTTAGAFSEEANTLLAEHGLPGLAIAYIALEAWVLVQKGQIDAGLSQMLRHKSDIVKFGGVFAPWLFVALADAYLATGLASEGIDTVDEGLELCRTSGVRMLESEIHRLKGALLLHQGNHDGAAQSFSRAIELARRQGAKSWELRATTSLARLLAKQGRRDEARTMLGEIYGWFTEGFDTADLKDAKALLDELTE